MLLLSITILLLVAMVVRFCAVIATSEVARAREQKTALLERMAVALPIASARERRRLRAGRRALKQSLVNRRAS